MLSEETDTSFLSVHLLRYVLPVPEQNQENIHPPPDKSVVFRRGLQSFEEVSDPSEYRSGCLGYTEKPFADFLFAVCPESCPAKQIHLLFSGSLCSPHIPQLPVPGHILQR